MPIADLAPSFIHMHVNRMIRSAARAHELVLYDFHQLHESRAARARKGGGDLGYNERRGRSKDQVVGKRRTETGSLTDTNRLLKTAWAQPRPSA